MMVLSWGDGGAAVMRMVLLLWEVMVLAWGGEGAAVRG
jgi:hypothetical protein